MKIRIGTRGSELALYQAHLTASMLDNKGQESDIVIIKTKGDQIQDLSFDKIEGKGFFTKELEDALLDKSIDIAVHSMKDLPTISPESLSITALIDRADPRDCLLIKESSVDEWQPYGLKANAIVGTSSVRRQSQIQDLRPDVRVLNLRGNVPTRIQKLVDGTYDAILLASAGIARLGIQTKGVLFKPLHTREMVPAPAQGVIAIQCLSDHRALRTILTSIHDPEISKCTNIERGVLKEMDGGCQLPLGVHCIFDDMRHYRVHVSYAQEKAVKLFRKSYAMSTSVNLVNTIVKDLKNI